MADLLSGGARTRQGAAAAAGVEVVVYAGDAYAIDLPDAASTSSTPSRCCRPRRRPGRDCFARWPGCAHPGGLVAVRDADYAAMTRAPAAAAMDRWMDIYRATARQRRRRGGRAARLGAAAGLADVTASASTWCFATPEDRQWWGSLWADRTEGTAYGSRRSLPA